MKRTDKPSTPSHMFKKSFLNFYIEYTTKIMETPKKMKDEREGNLWIQI